MKLSLLLVFVSCLQVSAYTYAQRINLQKEEVSLEEILRDIKNQSGYHVFYDVSMIRKTEPITVSVHNATLEEALIQSLSGQGLAYKIVDKNIIITRAKPVVRESENESTRQQDFMASGKVTASSGDPLEGVTVRVQGTQAATTTDVNGNYRISIQAQEAILVFSLLGYVSEESTVVAGKPLDIILDESISELGEVVVTALGISRERKSLSYSVTEVGGESFNKARENNLGNALTGKIAGVNATSSATGPSGSSRVIIRGNGSLSGNNQPLYVINGIPMSSANQGTPGTYGGRDMGDGLTSINPDDIESISVLKGGTAAALYGSRAANGVILITTKSGKAQQGIGVEYNSTFTVESPINMLDWQYEYGSGAWGAKPTTQAEAIANGRTSWGAKLDGSMVVQPDGNEYPYVAQQRNIQNFYNVGTNFSNTVALTGGSEAINFRFSVADLNNQSIVPNSAFGRQSFNLSTNANLSDRVLFESRVQYNIEKTKNRTFVADFTNNPNSSVGLAATNIDVTTLAPGYNEAGYETPWNDYIYVTNPYFAVNKVRNDDDRRRFIGSSSIRYNVTESLYARGRVGIDYINLDTYNLTPTGTLYSAAGSMQSGRSNMYETNAEVMIGYDKTFNDLSVNAMVGGNMMYSQSKARNLSSGNFNVPFQYFISNGQSQTFTEAFSEYGINSIFGSADIGYRDYLYLNLTGRQDWFSTLSPASNNLFYPSVGLSFIPSQLMTTLPSWLSYTKIRGSWAQVGGGTPDPYGLSLMYVTGAITHLGQTMMSINGQTVPNSLKPYTSTNMELGVEARMFNSRVGLDITFYNRKTTDDIVRASLPQSTGYQNVLLNIGEMSNRGIELLLTGTPIRHPDGFSWDASFNMAYNENKVVKVSDDLTSLAGGQPRTLNAYVYHYEGQPYGMIAGNRRRTDANGNVVYNNANGIPLQGNLTPLGRGVPPLTMGVSNTFTYKNFSLDMLLDGKFGAILYSSTNAYGTNYGLHKNTVVGNVRETGVAVSGVDQNGNTYNETIPAQTYFQGTALTITEDFISKADFIKLRQVTLGYTFSRNQLGRLPIQSIGLSFVARNLFMVYNAADNVDPESSYSVSGDSQGLENFGLPPTRNFGLNLSVRF